MRWLIATAGRGNRQTTYHGLPYDLQQKIELVVQAREETKYSLLYKKIILPPEITNIKDTRNWLLDNIEDNKFCVFDDDLTFAVRRKDDPEKFRAAEPEDIRSLFRQIERELDAQPLVGVSAREGANRNFQARLTATRQMRIHGIRRDFFQEHRIRARTDLMEDFDITLQVLRLGYPNVVLNDWVHNQAGSNTVGGCSTYRTMELQRQAAEHLHELHPDFVTVVSKKTKTSWGGQERYDVKIQWKRALYSAGTIRLLDS